MRKIVFIDSENSIRELYSSLLEAAGYRVFQATTAQFGMWLCTECNPDLIITTRAPLDADLESTEFVDVLRGVARQTPVLIISHGDEDQARNTPGAGQTHRYLELMHAIHRALDDGIGEVTLASGRNAEGAVSW